MSSFDFGSGVRGAQTGAQVGGPFAPYTAAAGFLIGGFVGGHKKAAEKKKLRKKQKRYQQQYAALTSPAGYNKVVSQILPGQRNLIASGPGAQMQDQIATSLARGGYSGTGLGEVGRAVGYVAPEVAALNIANEKAMPIWQQQIDAFNQHAMQENIGWGGQPIQHADPFGSAGQAIDMLGTYGSALKGIFNKSAATPSTFPAQYGNYDFSKFNPTSPNLGGVGGNSSLPSALGAASTYGYGSINQPIDYSAVYNPNYGRGALPPSSMYR